MVPVCRVVEVDIHFAISRVAAGDRSACAGAVPFKIAVLGDAGEFLGLSAVAVVDNEVDAFGLVDGEAVEFTPVYGLGVGELRAGP